MNVSWKQESSGMMDTGDDGGGERQGYIFSPLFSMLTPSRVCVLQKDQIGIGN